MNLKEARELARKVGATIEERKGPSTAIITDAKGKITGYEDTHEYIIRLGVISIEEGTGRRKDIILHASTPREAAELAVVETGRAAIALAAEAKKAYVDSDLIFGAKKS